jgi:hypothetical protein
VNKLSAAGKCAIWPDNKPFDCDVWVAESDGVVTVHATTYDIEDNAHIVRCFLQIRASDLVKLCANFSETEGK